MTEHVDLGPTQHYVLAGRRLEEAEEAWLRCDEAEARWRVRQAHVHAILATIPPAQLGVAAYVREAHDGRPE